MNNSFNLNSLTKLKKLILKNFDYIENLNHILI